MAPTETVVDYRVSDRIARITLTRPPVNALNLSVVRQLIGALDRARDDDEARVVVIGSGTPRRFSAGLDLDELQGRDASDVHSLLTTLYVRLYEAQAALGKPSIAAVQGAARGAGMTLAISCDVLIAGQSASFGYPEIDIGLIPGIHFVHLPRIVGKHKAFELLFGGKAFGAAEAERLGLVNRVVADDELDAAVLEQARVFAAKSPNVVRLARAAFIRSQEADYRRRIEDIVDTFCLIAGTDDAKEGVAAFVDKRPPRW